MIKVSSEIKIYEIKVENAFASTVLFIVRISSLSFSFSFVMSFSSLFLSCPCSKYSRLPITRTFRGNRKRFELSGARRK